jgi:hypothetical protein
LLSLFSLTFAVLAFLFSVLACALATRIEYPLQKQEIARSIIFLDSTDSPAIRIDADFLKVMYGYQMEMAGLGFPFVNCAHNNRILQNSIGWWHQSRCCERDAVRRWRFASGLQSQA